MARRPTLRQTLDRLLDQYDPRLRDAFLAAVADISSRAEIRLIAERLERGDIDGALRAVHLDRAAFRLFEREFEAAFDAGGVSAMAALPRLPDPRGGAFVLRFDGMHPRAIAWARGHSSRLVTGVTDDMRVALRNALAAGLESGVNPRTTALDIAGRINRATGRREGGIIGLTSHQERYVRNARAELLSGDEAALRDYLGRKLRDRRFDRTVLAAIRDGKQIPADTVQRMVGRYSDSMLRLRGEVIARTESIAALNHSTQEAAQQAVESGAVAPEAMRKTWVATRDNRTRDSHAEINGQTVGMNERFSNGLLYPGDPAGGPSETANCRCTLQLTVDFFAGVD